MTASSRILSAADLRKLEGNEDVSRDAALLSELEISPARLFLFDEFGRFLRTAGDPRRAAPETKGGRQ